MVDLISREKLLKAYDAAHVGPPGGARKLIEEAPACDLSTKELIEMLHGRSLTLLLFYDGADFAVDLIKGKEDKLIVALAALCKKVLSMGRPKDARKR